MRLRGELARACALGWVAFGVGCYGGSDGRGVGGTDTDPAESEGGGDTASADDAADSGGDEDDLGASGLTGLRLLTPAQHLNSVRDIVGDVTLEPTGQWRSSIAAAQGGVSPALVEAYETAAFTVATQVFDDPAWRAELAGCTPATADASDACIVAVIEQLGRRAWRRPLLPDEVGRYAALAQSTAALVGGDPWQGLAHAVAGLLQSPNFLYRVELGTSETEDSDRVVLDGYEVASRLSYLVWNTTPDDALLDAAAAGELDDSTTRADHVDRLLASPRAREGIVQVFVDMFDLDALHSLQKDSMLLPAFTSTIGPALREELVHTIEDTVIDQGDFRRLLDTDRGYVNAELAALYGIEGDFGAGYQDVALPTGRGGLLTLGGFLAINSGEASTSPTKRGLTVRSVLMCQSVPPPPPDVEAELPEPEGEGEAQTKRDQLEQHRSDPACASCHDFMDPIGLPLENFDALGGYRTTDNGLPIDASGALDGVPFDDAVGLGLALAEHPAVAICMVRNLYRYAVGHVEQPEEAAIINAMNDAFVAGGYDLRLAVDALASSEPFRLGNRSAEDSP